MPREMTDAEFQSLCDGIMQHCEPQHAAAITDWTNSTPTGLPVLITIVTTHGGSTSVLNREELTSAMLPGDGHAYLDVVNGPLDLIPVVLIFAEVDQSRAVWLEPVQATTAVN